MTLFIHCIPVYTTKLEKRHNLQENKVKYLGAMEIVHLVKCLPPKREDLSPILQNFHQSCVWCRSVSIALGVGGGGAGEEWGRSWKLSNRPA